MRFLQKPGETPAEFEGLHYSNKSHRARIRKLLVAVQRGFCAYSERRLGEQLDAEEVEHFNDGKKGEADDGFHNWYAVLRKVNQLKMGKHWLDYQPLPAPHTNEVQQRIEYGGGMFCPRNPDDEPVRNLIKFTGANDYPVVEDRRNHISRLRWYKSVLPEQEFLKMFQNDPPQLSFPSALEHELGIPAFALIEELQADAEGAEALGRS